MLDIELKTVFTMQIMGSFLLLFDVRNQIIAEFTHEPFTIYSSIKTVRTVDTGLQSSVATVIGQRMERTLQLLADGRLQLSGAGLQEKVTLVWSRV